MVITFLTMYNKNQFVYNTHGNYKNKVYCQKVNTRKPCFRTVKVRAKNDHERMIYNMIS